MIDRPIPLIDAVDVYFELSKQEKLARIRGLDLDFFVDDLPEILLADEFPVSTVPLLFDPDGTFPADGQLPAFPSWDLIKQHIQDKWTTRG